MTVAGARPQFVKAAMVRRVIVEPNRVASAWHIVEQNVYTGQHYDYMMSQAFFDEMAIPRPVVNLEVGSGSHGAMLGAMLAYLEPKVLKPSWRVKALHKVSMSLGMLMYDAVCFYRQKAIYYCTQYHMPVVRA